MTGQRTDRALGLDRRDFLRLFGTAALGVTAAGCSVVTSSQSSNSSAASTSKMKIPDSGAKLPRGEMTIRLMSSGPGGKTVFWKAFVKAYHEKHPNITITYDDMSNANIMKVLPIALRNGNAWDVFITVAPATPLNQLVTAGDLVPLDDWVPNFAAWKKAIPFGVMIPGTQIFNGKTYSMTPSSNQRNGDLLLFNKDHMKRAGYDPTSSSFNWDDVRAAAKKATQQGKGQYYGIIAGGNDTGPLGNLVSTLAATAGSLNGMNAKTGQYNYASDQMLAAIDLLLAMKSDGSFFPGWISLTDQDARARMPVSSAAMIFNGPWAFAPWNETNASFKYGVAGTPPPKGRKPALLHYAPGGSNQYVIYSKAPDEHKVIAGDILHYLGTKEGQEAWALRDGSADPAWSQPAIQAIRGSKQLDSHDRIAFKIFDERLRLAPAVAVRNPGAGTVDLLMRPPTPNLGQIVQGIMTGQVTNAKAALQDLNDRSEKELDTAITKAKAQGVSISRDDWRFPNWDPSKDYTSKDYADLSH